MAVDVSRRGPGELRPVGEIEFANGVAAMAASGTTVHAGLRRHRRPCRSRARRRGREGAGGDDRAGGGQFRGIRSSPRAHPTRRQRLAINRPTGLLLDPRVREGFARLAPLGLSFDAWMYYTQLGELVDLARAFPQTPIVLDHVGGPIGLGPYAGRRDEVFAAWSGAIRELAACPNVYVKLGGLGMRMFGFDAHKGECRLVGGARRGVAALYRDLHRRLRPRARDVREQLPGRQGQLRLPALWNAFKRIAAGCSAAEKAALFAGTAGNSTGWAERRSSQALNLPAATNAVGRAG